MAQAKDRKRSGASQSRPAPVAPRVAPSKKVKKPEAPAEVTVGSLVQGARFAYQDGLYEKLLTVGGGTVIALRLYKAHYTTVLTPKYRVELAPDTVVKPQ